MTPGSYGTRWASSRRTHRAGVVARWGVAARVPGDGYRLTVRVTVVQVRVCASLAPNRRKSRSPAGATTE